MDFFTNNRKEVVATIIMLEKEALPVTINGKYLGTDYRIDSNGGIDSDSYVFNNEVEVHVSASTNVTIEYVYPNIIVTVGDTVIKILTK